MTTTQLTTNLKSLMGMYLLTQDEVAKMVGLSKQSVWQIANGRNGPSLKTAKRLADLFGVPVDTLLYGPTKECLRASLDHGEILRPMLYYPLRRTAL